MLSQDIHTVMKEPIATGQCVDPGRKSLSRRSLGPWCRVALPLTAENKIHSGPKAEIADKLQIMATDARGDARDGSADSLAIPAWSWPGTRRERTSLRQINAAPRLAATRRVG